MHRGRSGKPDATGVCGSASLTSGQLQGGLRPTVWLSPEPVSYTHLDVYKRQQQGDVTRQRLSWYSPITDNALFVNQRGQRIGEQSMDSLARLMARDQVCLLYTSRCV